jgi:hypothetical protein
MSDLLNSAGLVMIPSGYKEDVVYSAVPTDGSGDLSFTRASNGTRINSAGLVEVCPWNFVEQSNTFNTTWVSAGSGATITSGQTDPNSGSNAWLLSKLGQTGRIQQTVNVGGVQTFFIFAKKNTSDYILINVFDGTTSHECWFNLSTGVVGTQNSSTGTIESFGNGWFKCSVTSTNLVASGIIQIYQSDGNGNVTGTSGSIFIFNSQLNIGSTAKPYFPTTDRLNVPRLTYQNGGGGCPSLLLEKQSTNYMPYSENISLWYAPADGVTLTSNTTDTVSPDGTNNASKIAIVSGSKRSYEITNSVAGVGTFSAYVKAGTSTSITLFTSSGSINIGYNLSTLAITTGSGTGTITSVGNGWYRITATNTLGASEVLQVLYTGTAGQTIYIWGFQVEASSYVTSYIFTNGASATRVADSCSKTGISSLIGSGTGTWFMDFEMVQGTGTGNPFAFDLSDGSTSNRLFLYWSEGVQTWYWGGADTSITLPSTLRKKVAVKFSSGTAKLFCNGSSISTLSISSAFTRLDIGQRFSNAFPMDGKINEAYFLTTSLTDAECQAITTI